MSFQSPLLLLGLLAVPLLASVPFAVPVTARAGEFAT